MTRKLQRSRYNVLIIPAWMLVTLYLVFSVGIVKATHFCMGREASVSYFSSSAQKCPCSLFAKEKEGDHCCHDKHDLLKLRDSQKILSAFQLNLPLWALLGELYNFPSQVLYRAPTSFSDISGHNLPPPKILYKIHCSFVFYDIKSLA